MNLPHRDALESSNAGLLDLAWLCNGRLGSQFGGAFGPDFEENRKTIESYLASGRDGLLAVVYSYSRREYEAARESDADAPQHGALRVLYNRSLAPDSLAFLSLIPNLRWLTLWSAHGSLRAGHDLDLSPLYDLNGLDALDAKFLHGKPDWTKLLHLKELHWFQSYRTSPSDLEPLVNLERLAVSSFVPTGKGLADLPVMPSVRLLGITRSSVQVLSGLAPWPKLKRLVLSDLPRVRSLAPLAECPGLKHLTIHRSRQLADHQLAVYLPNLESLCLSRCGMIESLEFLDDMPNLKHFDFCGTGVMDGNMRPLFRLQSARFWPRRNFSHTPREIEEINREVHGLG